MSLGFQGKICLPGGWKLTTSPPKITAIQTQLGTGMLLEKIEKIMEWLLDEPAVNWRLSGNNSSY